MEKKSSFRRLGRFFKSRSAETEKGVPTQETGLSGVETAGSDDGANPKVLSGYNEQTTPMPTPSEVKRKPFGSWRARRKNLSNVSLSPPSSPGPSDKSFDTSDVDPEIRPHSISVTSAEDTETTISSERESNAAVQEDVDKSKASPSESSKRDATRKPVLGKFGNFFNTSKKKGKGVPESPTSPTEKTVTTFKSEKEVVKERKKVIVVASTSKVQTHARSSVRIGPATDQATRYISKDCELPLGRNENETSNDNSNSGLTDKNTENSVVSELKQTSTERPAVHTDAFSNTNEKIEKVTSKSDTQNTTAPLAKESEQTSSENSTALPDSETKPVERSTPKVDRQNSNEKSGRNLTQSSGRRSSTDGVRRLQVSSQDSNTTKEESPKIVPRKTSRFSGKVTDSKYKITDKPLPKLGSSEKLNSTKLPFQVTFQGDSQDQGSPPAEDNLSPDSAGGSSFIRRRASGSDLSPVVSPSEGDIFTDKPKTNGQSNNGKVLAFDIYLSKSGTNSPTASRSSSSGDTMERSSPSNRKTNRKRRSLKSQSSQNEDKKAENTVLHDDVFDEGSFKGVQEKSDMSDSNIKATPPSPESNGTVSANQEIKAGANPKLSPKGESDKDKQQHPTSNPLRKKNHTAWAPSSPTVRKAQSRDSVFRNQTGAAAAKGSEYNQPAVVSTTKDAYVEKACVPGSLTGSGGEDLNDTVQDISPTAAGVLSQDKSTKQENIQANKTDPDSPRKSKNSLSDSSKSTITSQLNIPPKPKNVELPVKPKAVDPVEEPSVEVHIPKGNIASKVSLFESKKTSHRQIDFYATKSISQPKKFVERAKLNFGKQLKGNVVKDSSSTAKLASEHGISSNKKTENGHGVVKSDSKDKSANHMVNCKQSEDTSQAQGNLMLMEDSRNGLESTPETVKPPHDSILPSAENEQQKEQPTELANGDLPSNNITTQSDALETTYNTDEPLLYSSEVSYTVLGGDTALLKSDSSLDSAHKDMGNKHSLLKEQLSDVAIVEEPKESVTQPSDHVDSAVTDTLPLDSEELQNKDDKEVIDTVRPPEEPTVEDDKNKSKEETQQKELTNVVYTDVTNGDIQLPTCSENIRSVDNCEVSDDLPQIKMNEENKEATEQLKSVEVDYKEEPLNGQSLPEGDVGNTASSTVLTEDSLDISSAMESPATIRTDKNDSITEEAQNSIETSNESKDVHLAAETSTLQMEGNNLQVSTVSDKGSKSSDEHSLVEIASTAKIEDDQAALSIITVSQEQINSSTAIQDHSKSNVVPEQNPAVVENVADDIISSSDITKEAESFHTIIEHNDTTPAMEPKDDNSQTTGDLTEKIRDPVTNELDVAVVAPQITKNLEDTHIQYSTVINAHEEKEVSFSISNTNDVAGVHEHVITSVNGCLEDSYTTSFTNGNTQHTENERHIPDMRKSPESSFNTSVGEDSVLDSSSDMEIFAETIRKLDSPINLSHKRKTPRAPKSPGAYYGLPPIHEDYLEKILDNDAFSFGLGKQNRTRDVAPMALFKMQSKETAEKLKPKRASAEQSMLLKSMRLQREPLSVPQETCDKENADVTDVAVKRSRMESFYSGLKSPFAAREENVFSPTVTTVSTMTTSFDTPRKECTPLGKTCDLKTTDCAKAAHTAVREDLTVPSSDFSQGVPAEYSLSTPLCSMDNHLEAKEPAHTDLSVSLPDINGQPVENHCTTDGKGALPLLQSTPTTDKPAKEANDIFYFKGQNQESLIPSLRSEVQTVQGPEKINPRPGKLVILTEAEYGGAVFEVFADVPDCSSWELSPTVFIKTIRGCWILYELPNFEGRTIPLEEGDIEVTNPWGVEQEEEGPRTPVVIGSLRHVVKDYRVCQIDLFTDPGGLGIMTSHVDDTEELQEYGRLQRTCSIKVHWGVWLIYEEAGFQGIPFILEPGEYPDLTFWDTQEAYIGSLRPLKMGSRKVEIPFEPKIIIFEKPMFEGRQMELDKETMTFHNLEIPEGSGENEVLPFTTVGSMRVLSGLWVGYEKPGFEGHQYLLEEGDYEVWNHWGGYNGLLQSLRPILSDFSSPHMVMYSEKDFDEKATNINVLGIIANMEETGFGSKIQSINILSGVWVAYECPDFTGEQYILEKGMYSNFSDWGAKNCKISSVQPIHMETLDSPWGHFKVEMFSEPDFQGQNQIYEGDVNSIDDSFKIMSCKVSSGRWALYDKADFSGNLWVLEEGIFPNLCAMGCPPDSTIRSLKMISYEFSEPNVILHGKENFKGRRVKLSKESADLQAMGYSPDLMSLEVLGGIWVFYEYANYRGRQLLILPSKIAEWPKFSSWERIGSLRPLRQKRLYFKLRNKGNGMMMSTNGNLEDVKLLRIQVMEDNGAEDQIWVYQKGVIRCRIAEDCSLAGAGSLITGGSKLGFNLDEPGTSPILWSFSPDGRIHNRSKPNLVLDVKGGNQFDQQHIVLNTVAEEKLTQLWEICVL